MPCGYTEACVPGGLPAVLQQSTEPQSCGPEQRKLHGPALSLGVPRWKDLGTALHRFFSSGVSLKGNSPLKNCEKKD